jgi:tetratricopeptide (TPR) repeat protein
MRRLLLRYMLCGLMALTLGCTRKKEGDKQPDNKSKTPTKKLAHNTTTKRTSDPPPRGVVNNKGATKPTAAAPKQVKSYSLVSVAGRRTTFSTLKSKRVRRVVSEVKPQQAEQVLPPLSLTSSDGTGLELTAMKAKAVLEGPLAFTELHLTFRNPRPRTIEGRFAITLPSGAAISRLAMKVRGGWQEAEVVERQKARRVYEDFLHRRQDPALMEKKAGNEFRARIFPIPANGEKEIKISYSQRLPKRQDTYRLPVRGLPRIRELNIMAQLWQKQGAQAKTSLGGTQLMQQMIKVDKKDFKPDRDFEVKLPASSPDGVRYKNLVIGRIKPSFKNAAEKLTSLLVLVDTSASRAAGFSKQVKLLGDVIAGLSKQHGAEVSLQVTAFDQSISTVYSGTLGGFGKNEQEKLLLRQPLGASDLYGALHWARELKRFDRLLVVGDAVVTAGKIDHAELKQAVKALSVKRMDVLLTGGIRDQALAEKLVRGNLTQSGIVLDDSLTVDKIVARIGQTTVSGVEVNVPGAKWVWPSRLDGLQPDDEILVVADLPQLAASSPMTVQLKGKLDQTHQVALSEVKQPLIQREWINARIARLSHQRDTMAASDPDLAAAIDKQILTLSTRHRVLCDKTALLVLETEWDYRRYGIDRKALANILVVGSGGVEVLQRKELYTARGTIEPSAGRRSAAERRRALMKKVAKLGALKILGARGKGSGQNLRTGGDPGRAADGAFRGVGNVSGKGGGEASTGRGAPARAAASADKVATTRSPGPRIAKPRPKKRLARRAGSRAPRTMDPAPRPEPQRTLRRPPRRIGSRRPPRRRARREQKRKSVSPHSGRFAAVTKMLSKGRKEAALLEALAWRKEKPGDVLALVALGRCLAAMGQLELAARAYGSLIDLYPSRADMRRYAGQLLESLGPQGLALAADSYSEALNQRPDHPNSHRMLAYTLIRLGEPELAFKTLAAARERSYPSGRFRGVRRILADDLGLAGQAWIKKQPKRASEIRALMQKNSATAEDKPSTRFILSWETDANDVDFHIYDGKGGHAWYSRMQLGSGGELYADVTTGYGPECFTIRGKPTAYPYRLQIHYYRRGPMGYGMGRLTTIQHDGKGELRFRYRPFVVMRDRAYVDLGKLDRSLPVSK